jgi:exonuclease SbcD
VSGASSTEKQIALAEAIKQHYHSIHQTALDLRAAKNLDVPIIATGHLTALGVSQSESVRDIYIGTLDGFAADGFPPADYIALGHIHRPQTVAKSEHIRYSGSPIHLSFDELKTEKQVLLVSFNGANLQSIEAVTVPRFQSMTMIRGDLNSIEQQIADLTQDHTTWLSIEVEAQDYLTDLQQSILPMIEGKNVEVLQLRRARGQRRSTLAQEKAETLAELNPVEVFNKRMDLELFESDEDKARKERITTKFRQILVDVEQEKNR